MAIAKRLVFPIVLGQCPRDAREWQRTLEVLTAQWKEATA